MGKNMVRLMRIALARGWRKYPEVTRYVVLDDDNDCLDELPLFQPSSKPGRQTKSHWEL
jgi:hypothetical protein